MTTKKRTTSTGRCNRRKVMPDRHVYILKFSDGVCKIGITQNLSRRMRQYRRLKKEAFTVEHLQVVNYRCARCIEHGVSGFTEWFFDESLSAVVDCVKRASNHAEANKCKLCNKSSFGESVWDYNKACGLVFESYGSNYGPSVRTRESGKFSKLVDA